MKITAVFEATLCIADEIMNDPTDTPEVLERCR